MRDIKSTVRYLGFHPLLSGGRRFDFSFSGPDAETQTVSIDAPHDLFFGPDHLALQEGAGICYETLKCRVADSLETLPARISLTPADVAQHRKLGKTAGRRN